MPPHRTLRAARDRDAAVPTDDISGSSDTDPAPATRPNISYAHLAAMAIDASLEKRCTVAEIYTWIEEKFPFFRTRNGSPSWWKNCIRHNLSMKKSFVRLPGNGANLWAIHPAHHEELFSVKQRRRSNLTSSDTLPPGPTTSPQQQQQQRQQEPQQYEYDDGTALPLVPGRGRAASRAAVGDSNYEEPQRGQADIYDESRHTSASRAAKQRTPPQPGKSSSTLLSPAPRPSPRPAPASRLARGSIGALEAGIVETDLGSDGGSQGDAGFGYLETAGD
eukprot:m.89394 g.89394  ORF g.89394 m.89394 type:complete len:277 (+) comp13657_c2_seq1:174-1004(+)